MSWYPICSEPPFGLASYISGVAEDSLTHSTTCDVTISLRKGSRLKNASIVDRAIFSIVVPFLESVMRCWLCIAVKGQVLSAIVIPLNLMDVNWCLFCPAGGAGVYCVYEAIEALHEDSARGARR